MSGLEISKEVYDPTKLSLTHPYNLGGKDFEVIYLSEVATPN